MHVLGGIWGFSDKLVEHWGAMGDVALWHPEMTGVVRTKNNIRAREFEE